MLTLHPQGIHHGPQPNAVESSKNKTHTTEVAVMIESKRPFLVEKDMEALEIQDYAMSWSQP
jgi:homogentisate 1,2-dioxygenase